MLLSSRKKVTSPRPLFPFPYRKEAALPDLTPQLRALLQAIIPCAQGQYPAQEAAFPCAVIYESGNAVQARCDGRAHLHALEYTVEIWAFSLGETHALSVRADEALASLGLSRSACADLYDEDLRVHRRVMRYRALCDENGVLTQ